MRPIYGIVAAILPLAVLAQSNRTYSLEKFEFEGGPEAWGNDCESLSMNCGTAVIEEDNDYHKEGKLMRYLKEKLYSLPPDRVYPSGKHIACYLYSHGPHGFCLFFENLPRGTNHTVGEAFNALMALERAGKNGHCSHRCGRGWNTKWEHGYLKLDYVRKSCKGVCKY
ncbi:hypothetical protein PCL_08712 [Purpureocillium lilacinum]|uniref:Killer toxin Kp4 domain-containing protein n=1 Tax=Purpureocillium lilacinum TaxID=33203 RepID=A0A2U3EFZ5_PURLI|nr:hypothetical protein Purlil1_7163 [Purpureocillium lilacinum]PWI73436.1 hypothetical protein PCL_08712 [Purpureocillium lilacinum]